MKSSVISRNTEAISVQLWLIPCLTLVFFAFMKDAYWVLLVPLGVIFLLFILSIPESIPYFFIISHFIGYYLVEVSMLAVTVADVFFCIVLFAYICPYMFGEKSWPKSIDTSGIFTVHIILCFISLFSIVINLVHYKDTQFVISLWYLFKCCQLPLMIWIVWTSFDNRKNIENCFSLVLSLSLLQLPVVLAQYSAGSGPGTMVHVNVHGTLTPHHSMLGTFMLIPLSLSIGRFLDASTANKKRMYGLICFVFVYMVIISGSRSALVGITGSILVYVFMTFKIDRRYILFIMSGVIVALLLYNYSPLKNTVVSTVRSEDTNTLDLSSMSRLIIWQESINSFFKAPLITKLNGIGIGAYITIQYSIAIWNGLHFGTGAHNNFLHVLLELGIVGLVVFLLLFGVILKQLFSRFSDAQSKMFFFCTICLLMSGMTQETFWFQPAFGSLWLFYTFILMLVLRASTFRKEYNA